MAEENLPAPNWKWVWSDKIFEQAKKENKLVLLDMEAVWCHWCHVMDRETYARDDIRALMDKHYVAAKIDQDAYLDLSVRYGNWGWPATIIFNAEGTEIRKMRGFIPYDRMKTILLEAVEKPYELAGSDTTFKPSRQSALTEAQRKRIQDAYFDWYDEKNGGWGNFHRFIIDFPEELAIMEAVDGSDRHAEMAQKTLGGALNLIDQVWGGGYQYSDQLNWKSPHYEKIMSTQAYVMKIYSTAYSAFGDPAYKKASQDIYRYMTSIMMSEDGTFYTSQNADLNAEIHGKDYYALSDAKRRTLGMPRIDKNIYSQNNGYIIEAMTLHYNATGDQAVLDTAVRAAKWILLHHRRRDNGFIHGRSVPSDQFLIDNIAMARGLLALYQSTSERSWLYEASKTADYIEKSFVDTQNGGFFNSVLPKDSIFTEAYKDIDENIYATRFFNMLHHYSGNTKYKSIAKNAMRYLASDSVIGEKAFKPGILLTDRELQNDPVHIVVIGAKSDTLAKDLFMASLNIPSTYKQVEWYDREEGKLPGKAGEIDYPVMDKAAAFACANGLCSPPVSDPSAIAKAIADFRN